MLHFISNRSWACIVVGLISIAVLLVYPTPPAEAAVFEWDGDLVFNTTWNGFQLGFPSNTNWVGVSTEDSPGSNDNVLFADSAASDSLTVDLNGNRTVIDVTFDRTAAGDYLLLADDGADTLTLSSGDITVDNGDPVIDASVAVALGALGDWSIASGQGLTVNGPISGAFELDKAGTGTLKLTADNTYTGTTTVSAGTLQIGEGGTTGTVAGDIANNALLIFDRSDDIIFPGDISGAGDVTKVGNAKLTLTGANTFTGTTSNLAGILQIGDGSGTSSFTASDVANDGSLVFNHSNGITHDGVISGVGDLTKLGAGQLRLNGANAYTGDTFVDEGTLFIGNSTAAGTGTIRVQGSSVRYGSGINVANTIEIQNDVTLNASNGTATQSGPITETGGSFSITKIGGQRLNLTASNTHSGGTNINNGALGANADANFGDPNAPITFDGGLLRFNANFNPANTRLVTINEGGGTFNTQGRTITLSNTLAGTGRLTKSSSGTLILTGTGSSVGSLRSIFGNLNVNAAADITLTDSGNVILADGSNGNVNINAPIALTAGNTTVKADDGGTVKISGSNTSISASNLTADQDGTIILENQATATITGTVSAGTIPAFTAFAGDLTIRSGATLGGTASGEFIFGDVTITGAGTNASFSSLMVGSLAQQTTTIENGANVTVSGVTFVVDTSNTTFVIDNATFSTDTLEEALAGFFTPTVMITDPAGGVALTVGTNDGSSEYEGFITDSNSGPGSLRKVGTGGFTLPFANTFTGGAIIDGGTLLATNTTGSATGTGGVMVNSSATFGGTGSSTGTTTVADGGTVAPGMSVGLLTVGDVLFNAGATFAGELAGSGGVAGTDFDQLLVTSTASLAGTLDLIVDSNYSPALNDSYQIISTTSGVTGTFDAVNNLYLSGGLTFGVTYNPNDVVVDVVAASLLGDFDLSGVVDGFDFLAWQRGFGTLYDSGDLADWEANYGMVASLSVSSAAVPEPNSLALLCLGGLLTLRSFRRTTSFTA